MGEAAWGTAGRATNSFISIVCTGGVDIQPRPGGMKAGNLALWCYM